MSIFDLAANTIFSFKADTSDLKAGLKSLQGAERELAEQQLAAADARNKQFEEWKKGLGELQAEFAVFKQVGDSLWDAMKTKQTELRKEMAATGYDIERLGAAFGGLKTHMEVLDFAARANQSAFRLTNAELREVAEAVRVFTERGFNATEVQDAFTKAIVTGKTKGIEPYIGVLDNMGSTMTLAGDKMSVFQKRSENVHDVLEKLSIVSQEAGQGIGAYGEEADRAAVRFHDAWEDVKVQLGDLGLQLVPLVDSLAKATGFIGKMAGEANKFGFGGGAIGNVQQAASDWGFDYHVLGGALWGGASDNMMGSFLKKYQAQTAEATRQDIAVYADRYSTMLANAMAGYVDAVDFKSLEKDEREKAKRQAERMAEAAKKQAEAWRAFMEGMAGFGGAAQGALGLAGRDVMGFTTGFVPDPEFSLGSGAGLAAQSDWLGLAGGDFIPGAPGGLSFGLSGGRTNANGWGGSANGLGSGGFGAAATNATKPSQLAKIFGPVGDFDLYKKAFEGLTSASTSAFNAWIEGSESAGKAFKQGIGQILEGIADQMLVEGIKYEAYALIDLFTNPAKAAADATSGAAFIAGAALAGGLAHELGAGGGGGRSTGAAAPGGGLPSGVAAPVHGAGPNNVTVVIGDSFADDSPSARRVQLTKIINKALGNVAGYPG